MFIIPFDTFVCVCVCDHWRPELHLLDSSKRDHLLRRLYYSSYNAHNKDIGGNMENEFPFEIY